tara:strand:- start:387 stop:1409 length:1023 start_codon:yes stop_codon:yes gene_type:complete
MRIVGFFLLCVISFIFVRAQNSSSSYAALDLPLSARHAILNEPVSLFSEDLESGVFNPAMLNEKMEKQLSLNFVDYFFDINFISAAYALPLRDFGTIGISVKSIGYGEFTETDFTSQSLGTFGANEQIISAGLGKKISERWSVGASVKTIFSNLQNYQSLAIASDLAVAYIKEDKNFSMSILTRNYGKQISTYAINEEKLPFQLDFGLSKRLEHLPFLFTMNYKNIQKWDLTSIYESANNDLNQNASSEEINFTNKLFRHIDVGGELSIGKHIQIRIGYNPKRRQELKVDSYLGMVGFSWGLGVKISYFKINYGRSTYHLHGSPNYFSFSTDFSKFYKQQ